MCDCINYKVLYRTLCSHGCGKGNSAWRAKISNVPGSNCSSVGMFRVINLKKTVLRIFHRRSLW